ncbi:trypsin-like serine peptidase [Collimonas sp. NPDC087041]|uniref:trypsin-like serine peptidase n=1 Tax=Collimonas sp. NPDC087041 TaxID=3363960 RepID=UPI0037F949D5
MKHRTFLRIANNSVAMTLATLIAGSAYATVNVPTGVNTTIPAPRALVSPPQNEQAVRDYWTPARMIAAQQSGGGGEYAPEVVITPGGDYLGYSEMEKPYSDKKLSRLTGILFYRKENDAPTHCSASVIASNSKSLIVTAAHCVMDSRKNWSNYLMFVPAYNSKDGVVSAPLGTWPINQTFVSQSHTNNDIAYTDVAVARVYPLSGQKLEEIVGEGFGYTLSENEKFPIVKVLGYPGGGYDGGTQRFCDSHTRTSTNPERPIDDLETINCTTISGNSGGPILLQDKSDLPPRVVAVVHNLTEQTRLRRYVFPELYREADDLGSTYSTQHLINPFQ